MKPGLSADGRRYRRCNKAMQMAMRLNITPAEAQRRMRQKRRESRKVRQQATIETAISSCGTQGQFEDFDCQHMMRD